MTFPNNIKIPPSTRNKTHSDPRKRRKPVKPRSPKVIESDNWKTTHTASIHMLTLRNINITDIKKDKLYLLYNNRNIDLGKKIYAIIYIRKGQDFQSLPLFVDSGSDLTIIQEANLNKLYSKKEKIDIR